jgi:hypothetical protein
MKGGRREGGRKEGEGRKMNEGRIRGRCFADEIRPSPITPVFAPWPSVPSFWPAVPSASSSALPVHKGEVVERSVQWSGGF